MFHFTATYYTTLLHHSASLRCSSEPPPECAPGGHSLLQEPYRSATFSSSWLQQSSLQELICDHSLTPGWYQFQLFNKPASMPTHCVEMNHCGTQAPVWLSLADGETLPGPWELKQLSACAAWHFYPSTTKDCCMFRLPVTVRNCGDFYVYLLQPTQGCMAYCAQEGSGMDSVPSCKPDQADSSGTCQNKQPPAPSSVLIVPEASGNSVYLECSFDSHSNSSVGFVVTWTRLSAHGLREELKQETTIHTSAIIELDGFNLRLGDKIFCSSSSFFLDSPDIRSAAVESEEFFAGIRLTAAERSVPEDGRLYELLLESTVPVPCLKEASSADDCTLTLELSTSSQEEVVLGADLSLSSCVVDLRPGPCADGSCSQALLHFSPITDFIKDGNRTTNISVKAIVTDNFLWNGYSPETLQITVQDVQSSYCYIFTDPHTVTFDGRSYENYQIGTFVLFRSTAWPVEVHVRQWECGIRDGGDVISFDMCNGELGETKPQLSVKNKGLNKSSVRITESYQGRKLTMTLSSGAFVRADVAPGADKGHTLGLCGTFDGEPHNDFHSTENAALADVNSFVSAWRFCNCQTKPAPTSNRAKVLLSDSCSHQGKVLLSSAIPALDVTAEYITSVELSSQNNHHHSLRYFSHPQRQSLSQSDLEGLAYFFPEDHEPAEQARAQCEEAVANSSVALGCSRLLRTEIVQRAVGMCVSDLQLKDEESWLNGTLPLLENECERRLVEQRGETSIRRLWLFSDQIPEISELERAGLCDVRQGDCSTVHVYGHGFRDSYELKCEFVKEKSVEDEWVLDEPRLVLASFLDVTALECQLPPEDSQNPPVPHPEAQEQQPTDHWLAGRFEGTHCEEDIDDCKPNPCRYARCIDGPNSFSCICPAGMTGPTCREDVDECVSQPCFPGVGCNNTLGSFTCGLCPAGFYGDGRNCSRGAPVPSRPKLPKSSSTSPCSRRPCHPGVQCFESIHVSAGYVCGPCPHGLQGNGRICRRTNQGTVSSRVEGALHINKHNTNSSLFRKGPAQRRPRPKERATERNQTTVLSVHSVQHRVQPNAKQPTPDPSAEESRRSCVEGSCFLRVHCEPIDTGLFKCGSCPHGYAGDGVICKAVCKYPCGRNMQCSLPNICTCKEGYTGYNCHIAVCRPDCKNHGRCVRPNVCECPLGYKGPTCEQAHCDPPCQHGGTCAARNHCTCSYGYVGPRCEIMVCSRHCENGGECVAPDVCKCKPGWHGPTCASGVCEPMCMNRAKCVGPNICSCASGWERQEGATYDNTCQCPAGWQGLQCQNHLCERRRCVLPDYCHCRRGFKGLTCAIKRGPEYGGRQRHFPGEMHFPPCRQGSAHTATTEKERKFNICVKSK
ncbi:hypothetical protein WMY93_031496 [Mugilogobius chulae]|uniref:von Willebrand factor D and EGF domains n=1 Tax=Mugilogobius chulae TaxID=88201 RepID=A0AAW0MM84_9GOBI